MRIQWEERLWTKVDKSGECWLWIANRNWAGYGLFKREGKTRAAHREAWRAAHGDIPAGLQVLHRCDNRACVNPAHLFLGSQKDNIQDCIAKGRRKSGQAAKTHCPKGHPYDEVNTRLYDGRRFCRACLKLSRRRSVA